MSKYLFQPIRDRADEIIQTILSSEEVANCPIDKNTINLVCEEIVVNIVSYAYPDNKNEYLQVIIQNDGINLTIRFIDSGIPFNPLNAKDPDINLPLEERAIGGLGIYLVKQLMDDVTYEYTDKKNILTIQKNISH